MCIDNELGLNIKHYSQFHLMYTTIYDIYVMIYRQLVEVTTKNHHKINTISIF